MRFIKEKYLQLVHPILLIPGSIKRSLILFISVMLLFGYVAFHYYSQDKAEALSVTAVNLRTTGNLKANIINKWYLERFADGYFLHDNLVFNRLVRNIMEGSNRADSTYLASFLSPIADNHDYDNIFILDKNKNILLNLNISSSTKIDSHSLNASTTGNKLVSSTIYADEKADLSHLDIYVPIISEGKYLSTVVFKIDPNKLLYPFTAWHEPGSSGESYIFSSSNDTSLFLSPLKHSERADPAESDEELFTSKELVGGEGILEGIDYRGEEVLADVRKLDIANWYLVSKVDLSEVYLPAKAHLIEHIVILSLILILGGFSFIYYHIQQKLNYLEKISESENKLKLILEHSTNLFYSHTINNKLTYVSPQSYSILGYAPEELMISWKKLVTSNKINIVGSKITEKAISTGKAQPPYELELKRKDGSFIWVEVREAPVVKDGKTVAIVGSLTPITQNKLAEMALYESEEIFRHFMENSPFYVFFKDENLRAVRLSNNYEEMLGKPLKEILGKSMDELFPPELAKSMIEDDKKILSERKIVTVNETLNDRLYTTIKFPIIIDGQPRYLAGYTIDITDRTRVEQALRESEKNYRDLFENMMDGVYKSTPDGKFVEVNQAMVKMLGYDSKEEMFAIDIPSELYFLPDERHSSILAQTSKEMAVFRLRKKDGTEIWVEDHGLYIRDDDGNVIYYEGILRDVTERRKNEQNIKTYGKALEQSPVSAVITDPEGNIEYVNAKFTELSQYSFDEAVGKNPRFLNSGEMPLKEYKKLWDNITRGKEYRMELHNKKKNGELYWVYANIYPILNTDGEIINYIALEEDITEKKKMMEELIISKEKAEEMNRIKSYFFANMSHELRTPFVGIIGYTELLLENHLEPESREMVESILDSSKRLMNTLNKILTLTKLEFEPALSTKKKININALLGECYTIFYPEAHRKNISFQVHGISGTLIINSDERLFRDILYNIISNAIKFTFKGGVEVRPSVSQKKSARCLTITITDTGIGIPKEKEDQIWHAFRQVSEGFSRNFQGTGLGLTITKKCLEILGATVHLESKVNKGSKFTIDIPLTKHNSEYRENDGFRN